MGFQSRRNGGRNSITDEEFQEIQRAMFKSIALFRKAERARQLRRSILEEEEKIKVAEEYEYRDQMVGGDEHYYDPFQMGAPDEWTYVNEHRIEKEDFDALQDEYGWLTASVLVHFLLEKGNMRSNRNLVSPSWWATWTQKFGGEFPDWWADITWEHEGTRYRSNLEGFVCPMNINGNHWVVVYIDIASQSAVLYDSMAGGYHLETVRRWVQQFFNDFYHLQGYRQRARDFISVTEGPCAKQDDGCSCGIYALSNAIALLDYQTPSEQALTTEQLWNARAQIHGVLANANLKQQIQDRDAEEARIAARKAGIDADMVMAKGVKPAATSRRKRTNSTSVEQLKANRQSRSAPPKIFQSDRPQQMSKRPNPIHLEPNPARHVKRAVPRPRQCPTCRQRIPDQETKAVSKSPTIQTTLPIRQGKRRRVVYDKMEGLEECNSFCASRLGCPHRT